MGSISQLPDVEFYDIAEDEDHYIWLAADKGLYRYDGKTYLNFDNPEKKSNSIFQLQFDREGKLWCNNIYGQFFYVENDSLKLFFDASKFVKGQLASYRVLEKSVRIFTETGIYDINKDSKNISAVFNGMCISNAFVNDANYTFVINLDGSLKRHRVYKFKNGIAKKIIEITSSKRIQSPKLFAFNNVVFFTHKSSNGNVIYLVDKQSDSYTKIETPKQLQNETIYNVLSFNNAYWFLTNSGVLIFKLKDKSLIFKEQLFKSESITDIQIDFNKNYWFTTLDNGVFVSPNLNIRQVEHKNKVTASAALYDNNFVIGTNNGKLLFYNKDKLYKTIQLPGKKIIGNLFFDDKTKQLIVSINASESFIVNLKSFKIKDAKNTFSVAKSFSKINDSTLFYGNYRQGIVYKKPYSLDYKKELRSSRVKASTVCNNSLFVSYIDGFFVYNLENFESKEIHYNSNNLIVNVIASNNEKIIWLATQHNGLLKLENNTLSKLEIGLPKNLHINNLKYDDNLLWISSDSGLFQYNINTTTLKFLSAQDGLNTAVNNFLILKNKVVVTLPTSFYLLPKHEGLFKSFKTARVKIESVKINDRDTLLKPTYKLPHDLNKIEIQFNSNGFQANQQVNYKYRVKQLDTSWQNIPKNTHFVNFNSLANGSYTFELKAKNSSAKGYVYASPITFIISKPFWETYWFYGLVMLSIFGLIWLYFINRLKQKEKQRILEIDKILIDKKITNLRLENLRSQMNPHFIFNALNSIQDYIVSNEKELASSYLVKFSRLIRMYLDYSQQNEITLEEELNALKLYLELEKVRFEDELEYKISVDNQLNTKQIKVPSLFIQPYVENALKHGLLHKLNDRKLHIKAEVIQQNKLRITVEDNGIGREQSEKLKRPNKQHKPFATRANQERVYLYKNKLKRDITIITKDLATDKNIPLGTRVIIMMPIQ
ncbi:histidine kinase [Tamlana sp. 62-3]|uniref:Histidine kinase n=1 Tax=Neotamlana sargassicola TaxID=2883125 RepID=A0A9X1I7P8_9FLAO|nr:histidine kinase [Tamlana sargassicola]MCB4808420.1 histidine kinase [Tamlana sargassicola]